MTRIISVSGAAGTGKSTLLSNLSYKVDGFKVARAVLKKMGMDLYDILKDPLLTMRFQESILEWKITNDTTLHLDSENDWVFVERCPADFYAFAKTWEPLFNDSRYSRWLEEYQKACFEAMKNYDVAVLIPPGHFDHIDDGVRAKADTQNDTQQELNSFLTRHWMRINFVSPRFHLHRLQSSDIIDRVNEIEQVLKDAKEYFTPILEKVSNLQ